MLPWTPDEAEAIHELLHSRGFDLACAAIERDLHRQWVDSDLTAAAELAAGRIGSRETLNFARETREAIFAQLKGIRALKTLLTRHPARASLAPVGDSPQRKRSG